MIRKIRQLLQQFYHTKSEINHFNNDMENKIRTHTHDFINADDFKHMLLDFGLIRSLNTIHNIVLTSDKSILASSNNDSAIFSATVYDKNGNVVPDEPVVFYINDKKYDTINTDASGVATVSYTGKDAGDLNIKCSVYNIISNDLLIEDVLVYSNDTYHEEWNSVSQIASNIPLNFRAKYKMMITGSSNRGVYFQVGEENQAMLCGDFVSYDLVRIFLWGDNVQNPAEAALSGSLEFNKWYDVIFEYKNGVFKATIDGRSVSLAYEYTKRDFIGARTENNSYMKDVRISEIKEDELSILFEDDCSIDRTSEYGPAYAYWGE